MQIARLHRSMIMPTPILIIDKLHIGYGDKVVIRDLSLEIHEGEFVALLGASGSGKSSVLRTLAGFHSAMSGRIILEGKDITNEPPERRNVGMVFQNYALFPTMTAFENIALLCVWRRCRRARSAGASPRSPKHRGLRSNCTRSQWPCQAGNNSELRLRARSSRAPRCFCSTNHCPISTPRYE